MRNIDLNYINIIDVEATCWEKEVPTCMTSEIIEIGIAVLEVNTGNIESDTILIKPELSTVSEFCTQLTTLTQEQLIFEDGVSFHKACRILMGKFSSRKRVWASYGDYDRTQFRRDCLNKDIVYPFGKTHINIKNLFALVYGLKKEIGTKRALDKLGIEFKGTQHRGIDDAYNIALIMKWILDRCKNKGA